MRLFGRRDVEDVGRVDVEVDAGGRGVGAQGGGPPAYATVGRLPALRVAEEELHEVGPAGGGLRERVDLVDVGTDAQSVVTIRPYDAGRPTAARAALWTTIRVGTCPRRRR